METVKLNEILNAHELWLNGLDGGIKADLFGANLSDADLRRADLRGANLYGANLYGANLYEANLREANLRGADLRRADLRGADLRRADLRGANLYGANLRGADLRRADLRRADLRGADLRGAGLSDADLFGANLSDADLRRADLCGADGVYLSCPESGSFTAYKKAVSGNTEVIVRLQVTESAKRSSAAGRKCRCSEAVVVDITDIAGVKNYTDAHSKYDCSFVYNVGELVSVSDYDEDRWNECAAGIHFFITRQEAVEY